MCTATGLHQGLGPWARGPLSGVTRTLDSAHRLYVQVIGISFIDKSSEPKPEWLEYMSSLRNQVTIILVPTPTGLTNNKQQLQVLTLICTICSRAAP
jgi:hypothetical protein